MEPETVEQDGGRLSQVDVLVVGAHKLPGKRVPQELLDALLSDHLDPLAPGQRIKNRLGGHAQIGI